MWLFKSIAVMPIFWFCLLTIFLGLARRVEEEEKQVEGGGDARPAIIMVNKKDIMELPLVTNLARFLSRFLWTGCCLSVSSLSKTFFLAQECPYG